MDKYDEDTEVSVAFNCMKNCHQRSAGPCLFFAAPCLLQGTDKLQLKQLEFSSKLTMVFTHTEAKLLQTWEEGQPLQNPSHLFLSPYLEAFCLHSSWRYYRVKGNSLIWYQRLECDMDWAQDTVISSGGTMVTDPLLQDRYHAKRFKEITYVALPESSWRRVHYPSHFMHKQTQALKHLPTVRQLTFYWKSQNPEQSLYPTCYLVSYLVVC